MPQLLHDPADAKVIRQGRRGRPVQNAPIVLPRPRQDPLSTDGKLAAAHVPDRGGDLVRGDVEDLLVGGGEGGADILVRDVDGGGIQRVDAGRAAGVVFAAQVDVAEGVDGVKAETAEGIAGEGPEEVVVPLFGVGVDEDGVVGEVVVEVDDVGEVGRGFAAAQGRGHEEAWFGGVFGRVNKRGSLAGDRELGYG